MRLDIQNTYCKYIKRKEILGIKILLNNYLNLTAPPFDEFPYGKNYFTDKRFTCFVCNLNVFIFLAVESSESPSQNPLKWVAYL